MVTVSDGVAEGVREDTAGRTVADLLAAEGFEVAARVVVPDERPRIEAELRRLAAAKLPLVVTTGGTGLGPRDVTPEATRAVIEREAPGLAEAMRAAGRATTPMAALSRGVAGSLGTTLIVNLPGSRAGAEESLRAILPALPHAVGLLAGHTAHGPADAARERAAGDVTGAPGPAPAAGASVERELVDRRGAGQRVVLATAVATEGDPPCRVGQKLLLGPDGPLAGTLGCAEFDDGAAADAPDVLASGRPATRTYTHDLGTVEVFLEPHLPSPRLAVFSATPVALHLLRWARSVGLDPVLVEPRAERVTPEHRAAASVAARCDATDLDAESSAVLTDHEAPDVADTVAMLLRSPARFVGVMGSARHVGPHLDRLRELGFTDRDLDRVRTPVGIDIGARTAEEIALSILAGVVADRHGAAGGWLDRRDTDERPMDRPPEHG